jgi:succinate-semialdehyde dehydrogenase/glutarate-semialdehyde dehydrogenase
VLIQSINPATEEVLATFSEFTADQVQQALAETHAAYATWRRCAFAERGAYFKQAAAYLRQHKQRLARLITLEMGKPIGQSEAEVEKCAWNCEYYADNAERYLSDEPTPSTAYKSYVAYEPLGVVLAVMPWNFPFWQIFRAAVPAMMAGNTVVLKHASNVPQCALAAEEVFRESGFPQGVFRTLLISSGAVEPVIADDRVRAVTLTGSDVTGAAVASAAGRYLKKCVLELGGADPYIVLDDADLKAAAEVGAMARAQNTGQSCIAAKRFIVLESVADEFERLFTQATANLKLGDPLDPATQVGPMARGDLRDELDRQVQDSVKQGARVATGGKPLDGPGYFYQPTVLADVSREMRVWREETFGPAAPVLRVRDEQEAVAVANDSQFGLGASVWTRDLERGQRLARDVESGLVFINGMVASDPRLPFGGVKRSGYGRELGEFGIREFVNIQTIWVGAPAAEDSAKPPSE